MFLMPYIDVCCNYSCLLKPNPQSLRLCLRMNKLSWLKSTVLIATWALMLCGCVTRERVVYVQGPPPAPYVETVSVSPGPAYVWIGGSWVWNNQWVWAPGRWAYPPHPGAVWISGSYRYHHGHRVYVRGYWRY